MFWIFAVTLGIRDHHVDVVGIFGVGVIASGLDWAYV